VIRSPWRFLLVLVTIALAWQVAVWFAVDAGFVLTECGVIRGLAGLPVPVPPPEDHVCAGAFTWSRYPGWSMVLGFWTIMAGWLLLARVLAGPGSWDWPRRGWGLALGGGLVLGFLALGVQELITTAGLLPDGAMWFEELVWGTGGVERGFLLLELALVGPLLEELLYRELVWRGLVRSWSPGWVLVATTALFALAHGSVGLGVVPLGLWLGWLRWRTGSVGPTILSHVAYNLVLVGLMAV